MFQEECNLQVKNKGFDNQIGLWWLKTKLQGAKTLNMFSFYSHVKTFIKWKLLSTRWLQWEKSKIAQNQSLIKTLAAQDKLKVRKHKNKNLSEKGKILLVSGLK